jgi:hypothetical protein
VPEYAAMFEEAFGGDLYGGKIYGAIGEYLKTSLMSLVDIAAEPWADQEATVLS